MYISSLCHPALLIGTEDMHLWTIHHRSLQKICWAKPHICVWGGRGGGCCCCFFVFVLFLLLLFLFLVCFFLFLFNLFIYFCFYWIAFTQNLLLWDWFLKQIVPSFKQTINNTPLGCLVITDASACWGINEVVILTVCNHSNEWYIWLQC